MNHCGAGFRALLAAACGLACAGSAVGQSTVIGGGGYVSGGGVTVSVNNVTGGLYSSRGGGAVYPGIRVGYPYYYRLPTYQGPPLWEIARRLDPQLVGAVTPIAAPVAPVDEAGRALRERNYQRAVGLFAQRVAALESGLDDPSVPNATVGEQLRLLALAMLGAGMNEDACDVMLRAYRQMPELADHPLDIAAAVGSPGEARTLLGDAMGFANRSSAAEPWFLVGVLLQSDGKHDQARAMVEKARALGATIPARRDAWKQLPPPRTPVPEAIAPATNAAMPANADRESAPSPAQESGAEPSPSAEPMPDTDQPSDAPHAPER